MNQPNAEWLVELAKETVDQVDELLRLSKSDFIKVYSCETERVDRMKIEKAANMMSTLKFFLDKTVPVVIGDGEAPRRVNAPMIEEPDGKKLVQG